MKLSNCPFLILILVVISCQGQPNSSSPENEKTTTDLPGDGQIAQYVVNIFEDSKGKLWFGTMSRGVACYDPTISPMNWEQILTYYTANDGLCSNTVVNVAEDRHGILWFGTHSGLSKYDGKSFTNFTKADGLCHDRVANLVIDSQNNIWVGTWGGVCVLRDQDGSSNTKFSDFPLPIPDVTVPDYQETENWVTEIMEDKEGNMWFSRSGYAVCKFDPKTETFTTLTTEDGLPSNCVQDILEDDSGKIWFGSRVAERDHPDEARRNGPGGLCLYDPELGSFTQFPEQPGLVNNDVYDIYKDRSGNIWVTTTSHGVYKYDGLTFTNFQSGSISSLNHVIPTVPIQSILEDQNGAMWFGCSGGLYRLDDSGLVNVTEDGPWN